MQTSTGKKFWTLYAKEMRDILPEIIVVAALTVLFSGAVYVNNPDYRALAIVPLGMVMGLNIFLPFISSFKLLWREWNHNTIYLVMSLPVKGGTVLGSKLLALLSQYIIGALVIVTTGFFMVWPDLNRLQMKFDAVHIIGEGGPPFLLAALLSIGMLAYLINISFFSQLVGKLAARFSGLLTAAVFLATLWLGGKLTDLGRSLTGYEFLASKLQTWIYFQNGSLEQVTRVLVLENLIVFLAAAIIFVLAVLVYNRRLEL